MAKRVEEFRLERHENGAYHIYDRHGARLIDTSRTPSRPVLVANKKRAREWFEGTGITPKFV